MTTSADPVRATVVMTGAGRGIGRAAAARMVQRDSNLHLLVITRAEPERLVDELRDAAGTGGATVSGVRADLASIAEVRAAAVTIAADVAAGRLPPLRAIAGNAGLQLVDATTATVDGLEATFAVNVLANHVLITGLVGALASRARIVLTASDTHFGDVAHNLGMVPAPRWGDPARLALPRGFDRPGTARAGRTAYSTSKLAVIYLVHKLARELGPDIEAYSFNPGFVPATGLARDAGTVTRAALRVMTPVVTRTPWARTVQTSGVDLASAVLGAAPGPTGAYINGAAVEPSSRESYAPDREDELWAALERLAAPDDTPLGHG